MQLMVIEYLRNRCGLADAVSVEMLTSTAMEAGEAHQPTVVIDTLKDTPNSHKQQKGGTMRLGNYPIQLCTNTYIKHIYNKPTITERHRHRYEVTTTAVTMLQSTPMRVCANYDGLVEAVEDTEADAFYIGCQFHPEYNSSPFQPHPLFIELLRCASIVH